MYSMVTEMRYGNLRVSAPKGLLTGPILSPLKHLIGQMLLRPVSLRLQWYIVVVMRALYAQWTIIILQWKIVFATRDYIPVILISVPMVALIAWVAKVGENPEVLAYISIGAALVTLWNGLVQRMGWLVDIEIWNGTLEQNLLSPTPLIVAMMGKAVSLMVGGFLAAIVAFLAVILVAQRLLDVSNLGLLLASLAFAMSALLVCGFIFAPFYVVAGGRPGFFNAITPLGVLLSGFLHPISLLPQGLQQAALCLPTSWAMRAVVDSVRGSGSLLDYFTNWGASAGLTVVYLGIAYLLFKKIEERVRVTGSLGRF